MSEQPEAKPEKGETINLSEFSPRRLLPSADNIRVSEVTPLVLFPCSSTTEVVSSDGQEVNFRIKKSTKFSKVTPFLRPRLVHAPRRLIALPLRRLVSWPFTAQSRLRQPCRKDGRCPSISHRAPDGAHHADVCLSPRPPSLTCSISQVATIRSVASSSSLYFLAPGPICCRVRRAGRLDRTRCWSLPDWLMG